MDANDDIMFTNTLFIVYMVTGTVYSRRVELRVDALFNPNCDMDDSTIYIIVIIRIIMIRLLFLS